MQTQSQTGQVNDVTSPARETLIPVSDVDLETVRHAMFGVVNHVKGTGKAVRLKNVPVFGKTGTAQWVLRGEKANVVWFAGYVGTNPPLAFTVTIEGNAGQGGLSGGGTAAPIIAKILHDIQERPAIHGVSYEKGTVAEETDPLIAPLTPAFMYDAPPPPPDSGGFFSRFFR